MLLKLMTAAKRAGGVLAVVAGLAATALAAPPANGGAPEIDLNCATSALTLLAGGVLLIKGRFRR